MGTVLEVLFPAKAEPDAAQVERVSRWVEAQHPAESQVVALPHRHGQHPRASEAVRRRRGALSPGDRPGGRRRRPAQQPGLAHGPQGREGGGAARTHQQGDRACKGRSPSSSTPARIVYLTNGESKLAIEDLENAVAIAPSAVKYFHLAQAYLEASNKAAAKENLEKARTKGLAKGNLHPLELGRLPASRQRPGLIIDVLAGGRARSSRRPAVVVRRLVQFRAAPRPESGRRLFHQLLEVAPVVVGKLLGESLQLSGVDEAQPVGDFLDAGDLEALPGFDRLDVVGGLDQRFDRPGVEPGEAAAEDLDAELPLVPDRPG